MYDALYQRKPKKDGQAFYADNDQDGDPIPFSFSLDDLKQSMDVPILDNKNDPHPKLEHIQKYAINNFAKKKSE